MSGKKLEVDPRVMLNVLKIPIRHSTRVLGVPEAGKYKDFIKNLGEVLVTEDIDLIACELLEFRIRQLKKIAANLSDMSNNLEVLEKIKGKKEKNVKEEKELVKIIKDLLMDDILPSVKIIKVTKLLEHITVIPEDYIEKCKEDLEETLEVIRKTKEMNDSLQITEAMIEIVKKLQIVKADTKELLKTFEEEK